MIFPNSSTLSLETKIMKERGKDFDPSKELPTNAIRESLLLECERILELKPGDHDAHGKTYSNLKGNEILVRQPGYGHWAYSRKTREEATGKHMEIIFKEVIANTDDFRTKVELLCQYDVGYSPRWVDSVNGEYIDKHYFSRMDILGEVVVSRIRRKLSPEAEKRALELLGEGQFAFKLDGFSYHTIDLNMKHAERLLDSLRSIGKGKKDSHEVKWSVRPPISIIGL